MKPDIALLDDTLSAVDAHVGHHIFTHCLGPKGLLGRTTRVFCTNNVNLLPQADQVIVLDGGR